MTPSDQAVQAKPEHAPTEQPSPWVARFAPLIPGGAVLDLACGSGRHSRLLAALGYQVCAVDRDAAALSRAHGSGISTRQVDLESGTTEAWPFPDACFAGIVVTNYLHRPLFASLLASLQPGGVLIYETFAIGNEQFGKPSNPDFLLRPGELLDIIRCSNEQAWRVIAFEDGYLAAPKPAMVQRICVVKSGPGADLVKVAPNLLRISPP